MLGHSLLAQGRTAEATERFAAAHQLFREQLGEDHLLTFVALGNVGQARVKSGDHAGAEELLRRTVAGLERLKGATTDELRQPLLALGEAERGQGRLGGALATHRRALAIAERNVGAQHAGAANARREIALDLAAMATPAALAEARRELDRALDIRRPTDGATGRFAEWLLDSANLAETAGDTERAAADLAGALAIQTAVLGGDDRRTVTTRQRLHELRGARPAGPG
jgi:tetratricopeptide (TPR) repeat protein